MLIGGQPKRPLLVRLEKLDDGEVWLKHSSCDRLAQNMASIEKDDVNCNNIIGSMDLHTTVNALIGSTQFCICN
jgi:hypothetical protein